jgi:hypothetical protein
MRFPGGITQDSLSDILVVFPARGDVTMVLLLDECRANPMLNIPYRSCYGACEQLDKYR